MGFSELSNCHNHTLTDDENALIHRLRNEASEVKDCFTRFSFQALTIAIAAFGLILKFQKDNPLIALSSVLVIGLLLTVVRIGVHKYETANRVFGYELHMYRRIRLPDSTEGWQASMRQIGWEEAFYAWRIIQPTIYHHIYRKLWLFPTLKKNDYFASAHWISPSHSDEANSNSKARYAAGSYLQKTFFVCHMFTLAACIPLAYMCWQLENDINFLHLQKFAEPSYVLLAIIVLFVLIRITMIRAKRKILEGQLLSINTCAILWHAVVIAHFRALQKTGDAGGWGFKGYTRYLYEEAEDLKNNLPNIYEWCGGHPEKSQ